jgi:hypothetical protein
MVFIFWIQASSHYVDPLIWERPNCAKILPLIYIPNQIIQFCPNRPISSSLFLSMPFPLHLRNVSFSYSLYATLTKQVSFYAHSALFSLSLSLPFPWPSPLNYEPSVWHSLWHVVNAGNLLLSHMVSMVAYIFIFLSSGSFCIWYFCIVCFPMALSCSSIYSTCLKYLAYL